MPNPVPVRFEFGSGGGSSGGVALTSANNLSDVASASTSRTNLGLGTAATHNVGTADTNVPVFAAGGVLALGAFLLANANGVNAFGSPDNIYAFAMPGFGARTDVSDNTALFSTGLGNPAFSWAPNAVNTGSYTNTLAQSVLNAGGSNNGGTYYGVLSTVVESSVTGLTARRAFSAGTGSYVNGTYTEKWYVDTSGNIGLPAAGNIVLDTATGSKIGTSAAQKLAFHDSTPVIQRAGAAQAAVAVTAATNVAPYGYTQAQADAIVTLVNEIRATLVEKGIMKGSA